MKKSHLMWVLPVAGVLAMTACKSTMQMSNRPDFLSTYDHLEKVEPGVWRYVAPPLLANCNSFVVSPVKVLFNEYEGKPITDEQRDHAANFIRQTIIKSLSPTVSVVSEMGPGVGEIRIALTEGYRSGGKLGLCVQGEILDNSNTQVAAVVRTEFNEYYTANWEDKAAAREMVEAWGKRLAKVIEENRRK